MGELTRSVPFEMVDDVLDSARSVQERIRLPPARVVVCLLPAGALFGELGCSASWAGRRVGLAGELGWPASWAGRRVGLAGVWDRVCAGLGALAPVRPSDSTLRQARQRLRAAPSQRCSSFRQAQRPRQRRLRCAIAGCSWSRSMALRPQCRTRRRT
ncbi:transposase domain-containing protein [Actinomadura fibrosa]|uniref:Transposase domain-containing protein n=1 Tax=Actinomadura fibrosa TaxID=111802 RepID=A0ABW2XEL7_9ACTN